MSKYNIEVENITELVDGLNNAIISYKDVVNSIRFGCGISSKLEPLRNLPEEKFMARLKNLIFLYEQLLDYEKS